MPRSNRPRRSGARGGRRGSGPPRGAGGAGSDETSDAFSWWRGTEEHRDGEWTVRQVSGAAATKTYRCPGCEQEIRPGTPHVVVWRAEEAVGAFGGPEDRRHWHSPCWAARGRRVGRRR